MIGRIGSSAINQVLSSHVNASSGTSDELPAQSSCGPLPQSFPDSLPQPISSQTVSQPPLRRTYGHQPISNFISRRGNSKLEIDKRIMNLFVMDFQPFRMVEDRGYRELMAYAFPNYTIPTRKFFANNMLPAIYEKVKTDLKDLVRTQVKSICLTMDIWTSRANDSMIAVTGHYIEAEEFELKSFLLDCIPLMENHTTKNIADAIRVICEGWNVADKILLAVSDNGANIKSAIERELRWKHFPCYTHTLNLAVNDVLKDRNIAELMLKIKGIVRHFKQSHFAWQKLKKYQEQAGATPKRLLQDVPTRWNSSYYMLQRFVEVKEALNSAMVNLGLTAVTSSEWLLCEELCLILHPCEEVTRELSGQKYITGSLVIPITIGLIRALENLGSQNLSPVIDTVRQDLIGSLKRRFFNLNHSNTFCNCMFLDPRFKFYFDDPLVAEETKKRVIALVAAQDCRMRTNTQDHDTEVPVPSTSCATKSIWLDFEQKMQGIQPEGTAHSRAIVEVQSFIVMTIK